MKKLLLAVAAGIMIAIGGTVYLSVENTVVGALLFTVGLYGICAMGLLLFTGKVGYALDNPPRYIGDLAIIWAGNLIGTLGSGLLLRLTRIAPAISERAAAMCETKLESSIWSILILAVFCGILMYIAVDTYKQKENPLILFICVSAFILCGFEHCIANMYYFSIAGAWSIKAIGYLLVMTLGNSIGGLIIPAIKLIRDKK